jgi:molybdopterin converting factor small subunit
MVNVSFTANLARHIELSPLVVESGTLEFIFEQIFNQYPKLKPYLLDEQSNLRKHIMLAIDQQLVQGNLDSFMRTTNIKRIHIMQALSGG